MTNGHPSTERTQWLSREEWAKRRRTLYWDQLPEVDDTLSNYATESETQALVVELKEKYRELGRLLKDTKAYWCRDVRRDINSALADISAGKLPPQAGYGRLPLDMSLRRYIPMFVVLDERRNQAHEAAIEEARAEKANADIGDEAWARELGRRTWIERMRAEREREMRL